MKRNVIAQVLILFVLVIPSSMTRAEKPDYVIDIWPSAPPGESMDVGEEADFTKDTDKLIAGRRIIKLGNVKTPQAHVYLPPANLRNGASVVVCPGGGFSILAWDLEGTEVAQWLCSRGIAAVVLKYRVPTRTQSPAWLAPAQDLQRTLAIVRSNPKDWMLDPNKVGTLGFSAGGSTVVHAAFSAKRLYEPADKVDEETYVPNRVMLIYSGGLPESGQSESTVPSESKMAWQLTKDSPPIFMIHTFDDFVPVLGTTNLFEMAKKSGVSTELHIFDAGGHGYGLRHDPAFPVTKWHHLCSDWLKRAGWIDPNNEL
ncbi:MAG: alpha/beta hydrolase [Pirellula sp.]|jgi:acetyl esterase/lipase|nr:alpha/beta hydrolase [Pirellula sp.]